MRGSNMYPRAAYRTEISTDVLYKLRDLLPQNVSMDEFIQKMISHYLGTDCPHEKQKLCLELPTDSEGYLDMKKTIDLIHEIRFGKKHDKLMVVCTGCMRAKRIYNQQ